MELLILLCMFLYSYMCLCAANCYYLGWGTPRNYQESAKLFKLAAEQGDARSQFNYGECAIIYKIQRLLVLFQLLFCLCDLTLGS